MMRVLVRLALGVLVVVLALAGVVAFNTWRVAAPGVPGPALVKEPVDAEGAARRLARAVRFETVALDFRELGRPGGRADPLGSFLEMQAWLRETYPKVYEQLTVERIGGASLLMRWAGTDESLAPMLLLAHQDVVPVAPGTEGAWAHPPFEGVRAGGHIWGRGTWDNKGNLIAQMEAVEGLVAAGFVPRRTVYLAFGHDEEVGGEQGARAMAEHLAMRGVRLAFVLDEGLLVTEGIVPGVGPPAALIGVAEKGYLTVELQAGGAPGHSSMPPPAGEGAVGRLAAALAALEARPMPARMDIASAMLQPLLPAIGGSMRVALANLWLFGPLVQSRLAQAAGTQAMLRTTTAMTMLRAGVRENVLPGSATAWVNFRILPGDSIQGVLAHVRETVAGTGVEVSVSRAAGDASEPSPRSATDTAGYLAIEKAVRETFADALVAPGLMIAATDSRHFLAISDAVYRFSPVRAGPDDLARFHGTNERIGEDNLAEMVRFYRRLVRHAAGG